MTAPKTVACWVRNAGVWKKTEPGAKNGPVYNVEKAHCYNSGWQVAWADVERAINFNGNLNVSSFDLGDPPYDAGVGRRYNVDGTTSFYDIPTTMTFTESVTPWLEYDVGTFAGRIHEYQIKFTDITIVPPHNLDVVPTLSTQLTLASGPYTFSSDRAALGQEDGLFRVDLYDLNGIEPRPALHTYETNFLVSVEGNN